MIAKSVVLGTGEIGECNFSMKVVTPNSSKIETMIPNCVIYLQPHNYSYKKHETFIITLKVKVKARVYSLDQVETSLPTSQLPR